MFDEIWYLSIVCTSISLILACYYDYKDRKIPVGIWKPAAYAGLPLSMLTFLLKIFGGDIQLGMVFPLVISALIIVVISTLLGYFEIFGGADSIAMSLIALTTFYYNIPVKNPPPFMLVFVNNWILCMIAVIVVIVVKNLYDGNHKHLPLSKMWYIMFATRVDAKNLGNFHGEVLETIKVDDGKLSKIFRLPSAGRNTEFDTKKIVNLPDYETYKMLGPVWVMYYIPMIVPIVAAFFMSLIIGDYDMLQSGLGSIPGALLQQYSAHGIFGFKPF